jgi:transcriptional activator HAC1
LMQSSTTCRVPLAQLRLATRPSQRDNFSTIAVAKSTKGAKKQAELVDGGCGSRLMRSSRPKQLGRRKVRSLRLTGALGWESMECGITTGRGMAF